MLLAFFTYQVSTRVNTKCNEMQCFEKKTLHLNAMF